MRKVFNFSAGPSMIYEEVLKKAQDELLSYNGLEMSVMEMSHRSKPFMEIAQKTEDLFKEVMEIPAGYKVLLLQGGASMQFEGVPLNLLGKNKKADYVVTGNFAKKAYQEAKKFGDIEMVATSGDKNFTCIPDLSSVPFRSDAEYVHITSNNTIFGTKFSELPDCKNLVCDMSSNILSERMDISKFAVIYAGAQKNIGPSGLTVVIVREDLLDQAQDSCPTMLKWSTQAKDNSLYNTPSTFPIYMAMLTLEHIKSLGGIDAVEKINKEKATLLYDFIDGSEFYKNPVEKKDRSIMNVPFVTPTPELDDAFVKFAKTRGIESIKGHRLVGGMRASIYNAMPREGIVHLIETMKEFERENT